MAISLKHGCHEVSKGEHQTNADSQEDSRQAGARFGRAAGQQPVKQAGKKGLCLSLQQKAQLVQQQPRHSSRQVCMAQSFGTHHATLAAVLAMEGNGGQHKSMQEVIVSSPLAKEVALC